MKHLLACLALCASLSASAQVVYPYNPDANGDSAITSGDLLDFLPVFATTFTPQGITIDGVPLDEWLADLEAVVNSNAASIESLFAMQSQINELETANDNLQSQVNSLQDQLNNLTFSVDGLPPCIDIDDDKICDFADACVGAAISFWALDSYDGMGDNVEVDLLTSNMTAYEAQLNSLDLSGVCSDNSILTAANFNWSNLNNAAFTNCDLTYSIIINGSYENLDLSGSDISHSQVCHDWSSVILDGVVGTCLFACPGLLLPDGYSLVPNEDCGCCVPTYDLVVD
ncbi:MAG: pentapeptide repeat-containing protein [Luminiphilus sp.]|nr:pentapeptide repeat-containing protein [Luminiphilus sp.]